MRRLQATGQVQESIDLLVKLQELDRVRDRLQRKLDAVPKKLKSHTDGIAAPQKGQRAAFDQGRGDPGQKTVQRQAITE